ncbi:phage antirepressor KilAC domain-containing protein, partial [Salmonella enterica]|nr:phage antirepressor KilAC domain-containing protein [Salmonella enterica]EJA5011329.1 phage antirepressor KilAC domain-containing protein [Salmonella enterica]EJA5049439.1 phage antirepressor KilAC domain-containing protein [Salmonella enterica]EJA5086993.1 phage antirepressor KilAC domain-containing protein [Salmonella enterica]EJA5478617.1 phage antirepressor KilAC domain-containing protein [Salmonella enterica]
DLMNVHHELTMSSLDFLNNIINPARVSSGESEVENRHFIARIEDEIEDLGVAEKFYVTTSQGAQRCVKGYTLNMEQMTLVGMRESKAVRRQVLEKLKALSKPTIDPMAALNDPEILRGTLLAYTEKVITLQHQVDEMKPDVKAYSRIAKSDGAVCITDAAKALQLQPKKLFNWMQCNNWIYRRAGGKSWLGYQTKVKQQLLEHKVTLVARTDGTEKMVEQVLVTPKGLSKLSNEIITSM